MVEHVNGLCDWAVLITKRGKYILIPWSPRPQGQSRLGVFRVASRYGSVIVVQWCATITSTHVSMRLWQGIRSHCPGPILFSILWPWKYQIVEIASRSIADGVWQWNFACAWQKRRAVPSFWTFTPMPPWHLAPRRNFLQRVRGLMIWRSTLRICVYGHRILQGTRGTDMPLSRNSFVSCYRVGYLIPL